MNIVIILKDFQISAGVFPIPDYLNKKVVSLLCHMLQTDPMMRATIDDIRKHEWLQVNLPSYLFPERDTDLATLEHEAIDEVCEKFGVEAKEIIRVLEEGEQHDPLAIAYKLIIDNKRIENEEAISEFK